jgi:hypothetical protein
MKYDIYFHNDFDGHASAAVMLAFLESRGDTIEHYVPVKYDLIPQWLSDTFLEKNKLFKGKHNPAIIVDFPFHPQATFWFDHHIKPFRKANWKKKFKTDAFRRYDDTYRSACQLVLDSLVRDFGWKPPVHIKELAKWLDIIDFANYKSARQTIAMKEPAIQANVFIENKSPDLKTTVFTIRSLSEKSLAQFVALLPVKKPITKLRRSMAASIRFYEKNIKIEGRVMVVDLTGDSTGNLAHFAPYYLYPKMLYVVRFHPFPGKPTLFHVNVGSSPWRRNENKKNIGELLKKYGGGGHKDVGGVEIQGKSATLKAVGEIVNFLNKK